MAKNNVRDMMFEITYKEKTYTCDLFKCVIEMIIRWKIPYALNYCEERLMPVLTALEIQESTAFTDRDLNYLVVKRIS